MIKPFSVALMALTFAVPATAQDHLSDPPPWSQADAYFDPEEMAEARHHLLEHHGDTEHALFMIDRLEAQFVDDEELGVWDLQAWYGGDINKLTLKSEGHLELDGFDVEDADIEALYTRAISTYFDLQAGVKYDLEPKGRTHAALGFQGLAPYWFEVDGTAYLSNKGDVTASFEAEYEWFMTQRLILQPRLEVQLSAQDIPELGIGAGLSESELGLRLSYDIKREFAPYIGVEWQKAWGDAADFERAEGHDTDAVAAIVGVRAWY